MRLSGCLWVLIGPYASLCVPIGPYVSLPIPMDPYWSLYNSFCVFIDPYAFSWIIIGH